MLVSIGHVTRYSFAAPALYSIHTLRLTPPAFEGQRIISWRVEMPDIEQAVRYRDAFGNVSHLVSIARPHSEIAIIARGTVETQDKAGFVRRPHRGRAYARLPARDAEDGARRYHPRAGGRPPGARSDRPAARADASSIVERVKYVSGGDNRPYQCGRGAEGRARASARTMRTSLSRQRGSWVSRRAT